VAVTHWNIADHARNRYVLFLLLLGWYVAGPIQPIHASAIDWCPQACGQFVECETPCMADNDPAFETTCGSYHDGAAGGWCNGGGSCGDAYCDEGTENCASCSSDCGTCYSGQGDIRYPNDGIDWESVTAPIDGQVGDCFGNCGGGCSEDMNPCGPHDQYWELVLLSGPDFGTYYGEYCDEQEHILTRINVEGYKATGRWTYHGWVTAGCRYHDDTCNGAWWNPGCWIFLGCLIDRHEQTWPYDMDLFYTTQMLGAEAMGPC
jgi:hypothetical protein